MNSIHEQHREKMSLTDSAFLISDTTFSDVDDQPIKKSACPRRNLIVDSASESENEERIHVRPRKRSRAVISETEAEVDVTRTRHRHPKRQCTLRAMAKAAEPASSSEEEDVYQVEQLVNRRRAADGTYEYEVKWAGYRWSRNTWEREENIGAGALAEYDPDCEHHTRRGQCPAPNCKAGIVHGQPNSRSADHFIGHFPGTFMECKCGRPVTGVENARTHFNTCGALEEVPTSLSSHVKCAYARCPLLFATEAHMHLHLHETTTEGDERVYWKINGLKTWIKEHPEKVVYRHVTSHP